MIRLLHEHSDFVVVDKPAGLSVIPGRDPQEPACVRAVLEQQLKSKLWVVHRLDKDTSGALLFARNADCHRELSMAFEKGEVRKQYGALVAGRLEAPVAYDFALAPGRKGKMRLAGPQEAGAKPSLTEVTPVEVFAAHTWVQAKPKTGRTHQIRIHLAAGGHPLVFDHQYGDDTPVTAKALGGQGDAVLLARTPLHASRLEFHWDGAQSVDAPLPPDLEACLRVLRGAA